MRLIASFLKILSLDTQATPPPPPPEPAIDPDALVALALVMRERWWPDAGFGSDADKGLVGAALARCFPDYVVTVETCPCDPGPEVMADIVEFGGVKCDECATNAEIAAADVRLDAFLDDLAQLGVADRRVAVPAEVSAP